MKIGYARVSSDDQNLDLQRDALDWAGCERLFTDKASGARANRPASLRPSSSRGAAMSWSCSASIASGDRSANSPRWRAGWRLPILGSKA
ncbi:recombinase family protein [Massilia rhizosphaerae]|uniref:recombinase family protein n=1 Tax=Massilia rhizosphaerae TaxID=2784389 RepID=UPI003F899B0C